MPEAQARIGIVTGEEWPTLTDSDRLLADALAERGHAVDPVIWEDDGVAWDRFDLLVVRSCFGYYRTPDAFRSWVDRVAATDATLLNPPPVLRWNMHKFYLEELIDAGIDVLETEFLHAGDDRDLAALLDDRGWDQAVVKPAVATSSADAWKIDGESADGDQERFESALGSGDHLVQAFAPEIADGERSMVFVDGAFSHAWRSIPADGEFRSHNTYGGTSDPYEPPDRIVDQAARVLEAAGDVVGRVDGDPRAFAYARVDGIERGDRFVLMELELVEPFLGLHRSPTAADRLADAVLDRL